MHGVVVGGGVDDDDVGRCHHVIHIFGQAFEELSQKFCGVDKVRRLSYIPHRTV